MTLSRFKNAVAECLAERTAARHGLKVEFFDSWKPELDEVLRSLPEDNICPHELFALLCKNPGAAEKKIVLLKEEDAPIAVACFRRMPGHWVPVTHYIVPGFLFPVKERYVAKALMAVGLDVHVAWWRWKEQPPKIQSMREMKAYPTFGMRCCENFEAFWSESSLLRNVRNVRRRCDGFVLRINQANLTEFIIRSWEEKWRSPEAAEAVDLQDRILVAKYLEDRGLYYSLGLFDGQELVAGGNLIVHRNELVAQYNYRNPQYDKHGVMTRHLDITFSWAKEMGFEALDLGGSHDYKTRWAPENGMKWEFSIYPEDILGVRKIAKLADEAWLKITRH